MEGGSCGLHKMPLFHLGTRPKSCFRIQSRHHLDVILWDVILWDVLQLLLLWSPPTSATLGVPRLKHPALESSPPGDGAHTARSSSAQHLHPNTAPHRAMNPSCPSLAAVPRSVSKHSSFLLPLLKAPCPAGEEVSDGAGARERALSPAAAPRPTHSHGSPLPAAARGCGRCRGRPLQLCSLL